MGGRGAAATLFWRLRINDAKFLDAADACESMNERQDVAGHPDSSSVRKGRTWYKAALLCEVALLAHVPIPAEVSGLSRRA